MSKVSCWVGQGPAFALAEVLHCLVSGAVVSLSKRLERCCASQSRRVGDKAMFFLPEVYCYFSTFHGQYAVEVLRAAVDPPTAAQIAMLVWELGISIPA